jgi:hypothetical protein
MKDLLVDRKQWVHVKPRTKLKGKSDEDWKKLDKESHSTIQIYFVDSVLLNVSEEDTTNKLWDKLGNLYQSKSMVNKLFICKKLYLLRMSDGDLVTEHMNALNIVISQLLSVDIKITKEEKCTSLLCSIVPTTTPPLV